MVTGNELEQMPPEALVRAAGSVFGEDAVQRVPWRAVPLGVRWTEDMAAVCPCRKVAVMDATGRIVGEMAQAAIVPMRPVATDDGTGYVGRCPYCGTVYWDQEAGWDGR